ncbi:phage holin family protein [Streptomyces buecherae]|uniref:phage holin family protein n=2 Tax=Streptomyces buecherae TaxID=2763006 RepID=UPI00164D19DC|nr:phage holin family protein [Streptomyces buecherae]QNJ43288.1 phage holin family protein [Streptomyces buecherae]
MQWPRWKTVGGTLLRVTVVWAVSTLTMLVLAGILPDFRLQSADGDSTTRIAVTAASGAGAFGVLSALVWPALVRALLLVPAFVLGLLVFFLNGSLLLVALSLIPDGRGQVEPETAVVVAAVMSAASSATSTALAVRDDGAYRRRLARLAYRRHRRGGLPGAPPWRGRPAAGRAHPDAPDTAPGTVFLQLDGVGHDLLRAALRERPATRGRARPRPPLMETLAAWEGTTHTLTRWRTDWSSQTGASQLGILHGSNEDVPAFRWYEKDTGELMISNRPTSAAELQRRAAARAGHPGLLAEDGASRGNLFTGGADQLALVLSVAGRRGRHNRSRAGYFAYFSDPANATRTAGSFVAEVCREIGQSTRAKLRRERPRVRRGGLYPFIRAFATVVERDVVVAAVIGDMLAGRGAVYADLVAYDEVAHHSGPYSRDTHQVLRRLDRSITLIAKAARHAPRDYRFVLLSDHGQTPGETFAAQYGLTLEDLVRAGCGLPVPRRAGRTRSGAEARAAARVALHRPEETHEREQAPAGAPPAGPDATATTPGPRPPAPTPTPDPAPPAAEPVATLPATDPAEPPATTAPAESQRRRGRSGPLVLGSGNLGLISFPDVPHRLTREEIDRRHPALLHALAEHPGIGFLLVRSARHGPVVLGAHGSEHHLATGHVVGASPLAPFGPGAAEAVLRTDGFPHVADIMVNSAYDPRTGEVHAFEDQIGSHGGLGGDQAHAFLLWPSELSPPTADGTELVGAERVHQVLRRWLAEAERSASEHRSADLLPAAERLAEPVDESPITPGVTGAFSTTEPVAQDKSR